MEGNSLRGMVPPPGRAVVSAMAMVVFSGDSSLRMFSARWRRVATEVRRNLMTGTSLWVGSALVSRYWSMDSCRVVRMSLSQRTARKKGSFLI